MCVVKNLVIKNTLLFDDKTLNERYKIPSFLKDIMEQKSSKESKKSSS